MKYFRPHCTVIVGDRLNDGSGSCQKAEMSDETTSHDVGFSVDRKMSQNLSTGQRVPLQVRVQRTWSGDHGCCFHAHQTTARLLLILGNLTIVSRDKTNTEQQKTCCQYEGKIKLSKKQKRSVQGSTVPTHYCNSIRASHTQE